MSDLIDSLKATEPIIAVLAVGGGLVLTNFAFKLLINIYKTFIRPGKDLKKFGEWAVITGATDGIGKAYALALAKKGMSVVLISRTETKLQDVAKEINDKNYDGVTTKYVVCDYSKFDDQAKHKVKEAIKDLNIGLLINNVGVSYRYPRYFHELNDTEVRDLTQMNVDSTTWMTRYVLDGMVQRQQKRGAIVNISSGSAMYTLPLLAQYSAAKSYIEKLSRALNAEYNGNNPKLPNISVQCQIPFYVATKLAKMRKSAMVPTPAEYVAMAMRWVGHSDCVVSPFSLHAIQGWVLDQLPDSIVSKIIMDMHLAIRKKGIKKDAKLAEEAGKKKE